MYLNGCMQVATHSVTIQYPICLIRQQDDMGFSNMLLRNGNILSMLVADITLGAQQIVTLGYKMVLMNLLEELIAHDCQKSHVICHD